MSILADPGTEYLIPWVRNMITARGSPGGTWQNHAEIDGVDIFYGQRGGGDWARLSGVCSWTEYQVGTVEENVRRWLDDMGTHDPFSVELVGEMILAVRVVSTHQKRVIVFHVGLSAGELTGHVIADELYETIATVISNANKVAVIIMNDRRWIEWPTGYSHGDIIKIVALFVIDAKSGNINSTDRFTGFKSTNSDHYHYQRYLESIAAINNTFSYMEFNGNNYYNQADGVTCYIIVIGDNLEKIVLESLYSVNTESGVVPSFNGPAKRFFVRGRWYHFMSGNITSRMDIVLEDVTDLDDDFIGFIFNDTKIIWFPTHVDVYGTTLDGVLFYVDEDNKIIATMHIDHSTGIRNINVALLSHDEKSKLSIRNIFTYSDSTTNNARPVRLPCGKSLLYIQSEVVLIKINKNEIKIINKEATGQMIEMFNAIHSAGYLISDKVNRYYLGETMFNSVYNTASGVFYMRGN